MMFRLVATHELEIVILSAGTGYALRAIVEGLSFRASLCRDSVFSNLLLQILQRILTSLNNLASLVKSIDVAYGPLLDALQSPKLVILGTRASNTLFSVV